MVVAPGRAAAASMKRKSERRPSWAAAPPCSRRCPASPPGVKRRRRSASQELHRLDQLDDLYLDITDQSWCLCRYSFLEFIRLLEMKNPDFRECFIFILARETAFPSSS